MNRALNNLLAGTFCGLLTFGTTFFLVPFAASGVPDFIWILADIIISCAAAVLIFKKLFSVSLLSVLISPLIQFILLFVLSVPAARSIGISMNGAFGAFELMGFAVPLIFGTFAAQLITLFIINRFCKGKELNNG